MFRLIKILSTIIFCYFCYISVANGIVLLNSSYDVSRELFAEINSNFIKEWNKKNPENTLIIRQSHAGSTRQAMSVLQGLRADVVTYNQVVDIQILHDLGQLIPKNWQTRLPHHSSPFYSTMAFLVRQGNPKRVYNWYDLINKDLKIVFPNPKISGNGRYTYLAAWSFFYNYSNGDIQLTRVFMKKFLKNVISFDVGGRAATSTFVERKQGDVLINFESEIKFVCNQNSIDRYEIIIPNPNILAEFPVTWIDKNVIKNGTQDVAKDYLHYLYTPEAQKIITKFGYHINSDNVTYLKYNGSVAIKLFKIEEQFGDWNTIMKTHFNRYGELDRLLSFSGYY